MPVTIKTGPLRFKDPSSGQYVGIDVIAERKTSEQIASIEAAGEAYVTSITQNGEAQMADITENGTTQMTNITQNGQAQVAAIQTTGQTQVSNIETKGADTLDSIPDDYTDLYNEVGELKSAIKEVGKGFSSSSANLLKTILNSVVYTSDQSQNIEDLYNAIIQTKTVQLVPIKSNTPNYTTFAYEPKSWQTALVWEPDYTITGGVMTVTFDDEVVTNFDIQVFLLDASKQPYKFFGYKKPENYNIEGEWTPYWYDSGVNAGFANAKKTFSLSIPEGCYAFFCVRWNNTVYGGAEVTDAGTAASWVLNDDGITVVISGGVEV